MVVGGQVGVEGVMADKGQQQWTVERPKGPSIFIALVTTKL